MIFFIFWTSNIFLKLTKNGTWKMGMVGIRSFLFGESPGWSVAAPRGWERPRNIRPPPWCAAEFTRWLDRWVGFLRKMVGEISWKMEVFDGYQYCLYIIYTTIPNPYSMYPRMIIYIDVYIHIFLFVVFMDITGAFCGGFCFSEGDWTWNHVKSYLEIMSNRSDRYDIMGSGIYHTWDDSTQLPFLSLRQSILDLLCRAPF